MEGPLDLSGVAEFQAILDGFLDPIGIADDRGCFFWVNDASARFFGFEREELIGAHFRDRLVEEEAPGDAMRRAQLDYAVVRRVRRKDDTLVLGPLTLAHLDRVRAQIPNDSILRRARHALLCTGPNPIPLEGDCP